MVVTKSIELVQRLSGITAISERHKRETLCTTGVAILGQEDSGNTTEALEQISELVLFRKLADLQVVSNVTLLTISQRERLTFVTLSVAKSSLSNLPPILSPPDPPAAPLRKCGGT